jgi:cytochrome c oxidase assembly protein subunit 15
MDPHPQVELTHPRCESYADLLTLGFGTTVAMWLVGYLCHLPPAIVPGPLVLILMLVCLVGGGCCAGRFGIRGWRGGLYSGLIAALLNLLVLGSLLGGDSPNQLKPTAWLWIPGWFVLAAGLGILGARLGSRLLPHSHRERGLEGEVNWTGLFVLTGVASTFLLLVVGGLVTSNDAGLAVVDWPNSFGYNMFLYPLARMTGGIYYEHAHRLFGSLVGLTTLVITWHLWRTETRSWVKGLSVFLLVAVVIQGILGGLRVTGRFTLSTSPTEVAPSLLLAVVHGVAGQLFFALMTALAVFTSKTWGRGRNGMRPSIHGHEGRRSEVIDLILSGLMVGSVFIQIFLGALQRHYAMALTYHIILASLIAILAVVISARVNGSQSEQTQPFGSLLRINGLALVLITSLQILLGLAALIATLLHTPGNPYTAIETLLPTAHQAAGAILFAVSTALFLWLRK